MPEDTPRSSETPVSQMLSSVREIGSNLAFIRQELPGLDMPEDQRRGFLEHCDTFADDIHRLQARIEQLQRESAPDSGASEAMRGDIRGQVTKLHGWVMAARSLAAAEPGCVTVKVLLEESGANMLRAYLGVWDGLDLLRPSAPQR